MEQVFQDVAPYEYMKQFCHNSNAFSDDSCSHRIILCIYCTKSYCPCFLSLAIQTNLLFIIHFPFSYDSTQQLRTPTEKRYDV